MQMGDDVLARRLAVGRDVVGVVNRPLDLIRVVARAFGC